MDGLKVYIADDHTLYREAMLGILCNLQRIMTVKDASNGKELMELVREDIPDIIIIDLKMPVWDGMKTCKKIVHEYPEVKIVVVSMFSDLMSISSLMKQGANAFLTKDMHVKELEYALYSLADGRNYKNQLMDEALLYGFNDKEYLNQSQTFSKREESIIEKLCKGLTSKQIAFDLSLSENTIRNHRVRIMKKAGVKCVAELVNFVLTKTSR